MESKKQHILIVSDSVQSFLLNELRTSLGESFIIDDLLIESWKKEFVLLSGMVSHDFEYQTVIFIPSIFRMMGLYYSDDNEMLESNYVNDFLELIDLFRSEQKILLKTPFNYSLNFTVTGIISKTFHEITRKAISVDLVELGNLGISQSSDLRLWHASSIELHPEYSKTLAQQLSGYLLSYQKLIKCIVFDLDNTIWSGLAGEQSIAEIEIKGGASGESYVNIQNWLKWHREQGIVLAICSKNNDDTAWSVFGEHPDMILQKGDIVARRINWENKHENILSLSKELNIGLDQIMFLDDQRIEREQIRAFLPEVLVPELSEDPSDSLSALWSLNLVRDFNATDVDVRRTEMYQEEALRRESSLTFKSQDEFLASLNMKARIEPLSQKNLLRAEQLSLRTNQFNFRTIRYSKEELSNVINDQDHLSFLVELEDKYGDYGAVSFVVLNIQSDLLFIENWLMSCRVFKRSLEHFTFNEILRLAEERNCTRIVCEYVPTQKNAYIKDLPKELGFNESNDQYVLDVQKSKKIRTAITKMKHD